jgi:serine/threonine protein phosphatase PrpC
VGQGQNINQDAFILTPNLQKKSAMHFFAVLDGHGDNGLESANFVKLKMP